MAGLTAHTFTGQPLDPDTGLMYYRARWYDPRLGRFVQADTVVPEPGNPQALNRYAYVLNNPLRYVDPTGHWYGPDRYDPAGIETPEEGIAFWSMYLRYTVPLYSQLDNRGAPLVPWTSCGPTSQAMLWDYWRYEQGLSLQGSQGVVDYAKSRGLYIPNDPERVYTSPASMVAIAQGLLEVMEEESDKDDIEMTIEWGHAPADPERAQEWLKDWLGRGYPMIVDVTTLTKRDAAASAHFVLVTGVSSEGNVYFHDPYSGGDLNGDGLIDLKELGATRREVSWSDFYWAWMHNSDARVGGAGWWLLFRPIEGE